nr:Chain A, HSV1 large terminase NLS [Human alphaherpesvirus 1]5HUW_B Chain B, HSV1 large terminase NLS [Human alphaherpesvirus 1]
GPPKKRAKVDVA